MPPRSTPSERQRRLGAELRKLRTGARMSGDEAGALLGVERTRISHIEAGRVDVPRNGLYKLLRAYGCPEGPLFEGLMEMAHDRGKGWWDEFRDVVPRRHLDLAELESRASAICMHEPMFIPGMLQTPAYARAVIQATGRDPEHIDRYVGFRVARQRILEGDRPAAYHAVIHEAALRVRVGGVDVMRKQLLRLIEVSRLPNVTLQIFPFERGAYAAFSRPFLIFHGSTPELRTVYLERPDDSVFLGDGERIEGYAKMFEKLADLALAPVDPEAAPESHLSRDSLGLIQHAIYEL
ncbi:helix-turn-helix domain-containing protein [Streptomyces palmae]|uniref:XRE family transcriptional regulator n=1 Tax=Streptomyces palmae TaxID=1701085 RepID=A0A4Z0HCX4_9ACTN|nr:helix-turn-helix transcriptional regulator [Streptomyces palmae]TGB17945.1 XRE family transcriptional regulator [Streptomyces palmae]